MEAASHFMIQPWKSLCIAFAKSNRLLSKVDSKMVRIDCNQPLTIAIGRRVLCEMDSTSVCTEMTGCFKGRVRG